MLKEYTPKYEDHFPNAYVRFKQMDYQAAKNPLEIYVQGDNWDGMQEVADTIKWYMKQQPELQWVHSDFDEYARRIAITLHTDEAFRLGVTETMLSLYLASVTEGAALTTIWENDVKVPVMLYTSGVDSMSIDHLRDLMVPTAYPGVWVPLRQVADCEPAWHHATLVHRNGIRTIAVGADLQGKTSQVAAEKKVKKWIRSQNLKREGVSISYGGLSSINGQMIPQILWSVVAALLVMFVLLLYDFGNVSLALLTLSSAALCIFGAFLGLWIFGLDISITAVLGIVSLIGIIVRNAIMMYEYAEELRKTML